MGSKRFKLCLNERKFDLGFKLQTKCKARKIAPVLAKLVFNFGGLCTQVKESRDLSGN